MTHTKSEIRKALSVCARDGGSCRADGCPYAELSIGCFIEHARDTLEYIMELEARVAELEGRPSDMPGTITRTGVILSIPEFTQAQKNAMAETVAKAMVGLSEDRIRKAVEDYRKSMQP